MMLYQAEQNEKPDRGHSRNEFRVTENRLWSVAISLELEAGVLLRKGTVGRRQPDGSVKNVASWDYGERDDDSDIQFKVGKLPQYIQDICIDLGVILSNRFPFTGIEYADPDYDPVTGYSKYIRGI